MPTFKSPIDPTDTHGYPIIAVGWEDNYFEKICVQLGTSFPGATLSIQQRIRR